MAGAVFVTGTTGFIGGELLKRLLSDDAGGPIFALARAKDEAHLRRRARETFFKLYGDDVEAEKRVEGRVTWVRGDIAEERLGLSSADWDAITADVTTIYHAAASTEFNHPLELARRINTEGARNVLSLADAIGGARLERYAHISTAYVAGCRSGICEADDLPGPDAGYSNTYEQTKADAERLLRARMGDLPITVLRPSIVVGDSATGRTYNFNVLYFPIKLIHRGALPYVVGRRHTTLDIVPVDYVVDATIALAQHPDAAGGTFHLTAGADAIALQRFAAVVGEYYNRKRAEVGSPSVPLTRVIGPLRWKVLEWWLRRRLKRRALAQLDSFLIYRPYLVAEKVFANAKTAELIGAGVPYPPILSYLERVAEYAANRNWGKRVSWDPALLESGVWAGASALPSIESAESPESA